MSLKAIMQGDTGPGEFTQLCRALCLARGDWATAARIAEQRRALPRVANICKAAVSYGGLDSTSAWGDELGLTAVIGGFLASLRGQAVFDTLLPSTMQLPLQQRVALVSGAATGAVVPEASVVPLSSLALASDQLAEQKAVALLCVNDELLRFQSAGTDPFAVELRRAISRAVDKAFIDQMTADLSAVTSSGSNVAAVRHDFAQALASMSTSAASTLFCVMHADNAKALATMGGSDASPFAMTPSGGRMFGMQALVSDAVAAGDIVIIDASAIATNGGTLELNSTNQAMIQLSSTPDSPPTAATIWHNMFTEGRVALKCVRWFGCLLLRSDGCALIQNASYVGGNSPP